MQTANVEGNIRENHNNECYRNNDACYYKQIINYLYSIEKIHTNKKNDLKIRDSCAKYIQEIKTNVPCEEEKFLAIHILDRIFETGKIKISKLILLVLTSFWIASKYEEEGSYSTEDIIFLSDNKYNKSNIIGMESMILKTLNYKIGEPHILSFLPYFADYAKLKPKTFILAKYLCVLASINHIFLDFLPSKIAAAAIYTAIKMGEEKYTFDWNKNLKYYTKYKEYDLEEVVKLFYNVFSHSEKVGSCLYELYKKESETC